MLRRLSLLIRNNAWLIIILFLGAALRFWGIGYGLPYAFIADEPNYLTITLKMLKTGDLNPHWWLYPSLMFYLSVTALVLSYSVGNLFGVSMSFSQLPLPQLITMGVGRFIEPSQVMIVRGLIALFSTITIVIIFLIGRQTSSNRWVALIAALFLAVSPTVLDSSQIINPDIYALFFSTISFFFALRIVDDPRARDYIFAGIAAGLAAASKYNAGLIVIAIICAHFLGFGFSGWRRREIYIAAFAACIGFAIGSPFALIDLPNFIDGVRWQAFSYSTEGHAGQEGDAFRWYVGYLWSAEIWVIIGALLGAVRAFFTRSKKQIVLAIVSVVYFAFISILYTRNARTVMLILPYLYVLAAIFLIDASEWLIQINCWRREIVGVGLVIIVGLMLVVPLQSAIATDIRLTQPDAREPARMWIEENLPAQSRIAVEPYAPFIDPEKFAVRGAYSFIDHTAEWYAQNGFEYLVFSYGTFGRYYEDAARYPNEKASYDALFAKFSLVKQFLGGNEIRIYKTDSPIVPQNHQPARFGIYSSWVELLGYDADAKWSRGEQMVTLYWRRIDQTQNKPLRLTARLLNASGKEIASSNGMLFDQANLDSVVRVPLKINVPAETAPGLYRLELSLDADGVDNVPVLGLDNLPASDKQFIGSFKIASSVSVADLRNARPVNAKFGNTFVLSAILLSDQIRAGSPLTVSLYWQSIAKTDKDYTMFVHLLDATGKVVAQIDAQPRNNTYPTSIWDAGEIIRDDYVLSVPKDLPADAYKIEIGVYEYPSLIRLPIVDVSGKNIGDHWILDLAR